MGRVEKPPIFCYRFFLKKKKLFLPGQEWRKQLYYFFIVYLFLIYFKATCFIDTLIPPTSYVGPTSYPHTPVYLYIPPLCMYPPEVAALKKIRNF
jgi:hypothetical protein